MKNKIKTVYMAVLAIIVWFGLILQFYISTEKYVAEGRSFFGAIIQIISYFTIETNLLIAIALTAILLAPRSSWGKFFSRISVLAAINVYILIVGIVYASVLKGIWKLEGLFKLTDTLLHTISPVLFVLFWLFFVPKGHIKWNQIFLWAIFPLAYLGYSLIRGPISGDYPYPFINADKLGYGQVAINSVFVLLAFLAISACLIFISKLFKKTE
jgi:hypothetical protein